MHGTLRRRRLTALRLQALSSVSDAPVWLVIASYRYLSRAKPLRLTTSSSGASAPTSGGSSTSIENAS